MADLKDAPLFQDLDNKTRDRLDRHFRHVEHPAGYHLMDEGGGGISFMVLLSGEAEVNTVDGRTLTLREGDHFGEMALLNGEPRSATITAKSDVVIAGLTEWDFKPFLMENPEVAYRLLQSLSSRLRAAEADRS